MCAVVVFDKFSLIALKVSMWLKLAECVQSGQNDYQQLPVASDKLHRLAVMLRLQSTLCNGNGFGPASLGTKWFYN